MNSDATQVKTFLSGLTSRMYKVALICISDARRSRDITTDLGKEGSVHIVDCIEEILPTIQPGCEGIEEIIDLLETMARRTDRPLFLRDFSVILSALPGGESEASQLLSALSRSRPTRAIGLGLHRRDLVPPDFPKERVLQL